MFLPSQLATTHESVQNCMSGHFSLKAKWVIGCAGWSSILERFLFTAVLQGPCRKLWLSAFKSRPWIVKNICKPGPNLFFLFQLIIGNSPWGHRYKQGEGSIADVGPWAFGSLIHVTYLCLQCLLRPDHVYTISIRWWNSAAHVQFCDLVCQITPVHHRHLGSHGKFLAHD